MGKKKVKKHRHGGSELVTASMIAEAALLGAIFTVLAVQMLRLEKFETEKNAMLFIFALVIIGANLVHTSVRFSGLNLRQNWLLMSVFCLLGVMTVSTVFSVNRPYSLMGEPARSHGLLTYVIYATLLWQAVQSGARLKKSLLPLLIPPAFVMCLWGYFQSQIEARPGSTTGQPNFLSMWLVIFLIYLISEMFKQQVFSRQKALLLLYYMSLIVMSLLTIVFVLSSRGALLGLVVSLLIAVVVLASVYRQRLLIIAGMVVFAVAIVAYTSLSWDVQADAVALHEMGTGRLLVPNDQSRIELWRAGVAVIEQQGHALIMPEEVSDNWLFLRPILGYGLNTIEYTQSRFGAIVGQDLYIDRFHNIFLDAFVEIGLLGLLAWIAVYETAFFMLLKQLGFLESRRAAMGWFGLQVLCVPVGIGLAFLMMRHDDLIVLLPFGSGLAMIGGTVLWIARAAFKPVDMGYQLKGKGYSIAALCIVSAQLMIAQLNIVPVAGQTLFWIMLGLALSDHGEGLDSETIEIEPVYWYVGILLTGLFIIFSLGQSMNNSFVQSPQDLSEIPILLAGVLVVGGAGLILTHQKPEPVAIASRMLMIVVAWGAFFAFRTVMIDVAGQNLEQTLTGSTMPTIGDFRQPFTIIAFIGITLVIISMGVLLGVEKHKFSILSSITPMSTGVAIIAILIGSLAYINDFTQSALHETANGFRDTDQPQALIAAELIYSGLLTDATHDPVLRVDRVSGLMKQVVFVDTAQQDALFEQMQHEYDLILRQIPAFINSRRWVVFEAAYVAFLSQHGRDLD